MRLKSLKLAGFKSFANVTTFTFPRGITAIVGPNGCGKSNIIDAIRWVLGETSAKQLRGGAMSDVIFAGTQDKAAKSVASVELTFEHTQDETTGIRHALNLYQELSIRRQVNKDGRSDYFINGTRARRRDVVDVFLGTGLGARSYAVIEQGMIGRIVESSPMQLREFIEEAAGVSRYQARREETQTKLEKTRDNLARLQDMQSEMTRQQKRLAKQAASAQQHQQLSEQLTDVQQQLAIQQLYQAKEAQLKQKVAHDDCQNQLNARQADYERLKSKQDKLTAKINQEQWLKDDAQSVHYELQLDYQKAEQQWQSVQNEHTQTQQQLSHSQQQRQQIADEITELQTNITAQQDLLAEHQPKLEQLSTARTDQQKNEQMTTRAYYEAQNELTRLQAQRRDLEQQRMINHQATQQHQVSQDKWTRRHNQWQTLWDKLQASAHGTRNKDKSNNEFANEQSANITALKQQLQQLERQQESIDEQIDLTEPQVRALTQQLQGHKQTLNTHEKRGAALAGEYDTLHQILHPKPIHPSQPINAPKVAVNTATATATADAQPLPVSTLREQIELSAQGQAHAPLLDQWLAPWLSSHVLKADTSTESQDKKDDFVSALNKYPHATDGHSLWLPAQKNAQNTDADALIRQLPDTLTNKVIPLSALIAKPNLAIWQQCYLYLKEISDADDEENLNVILPSLPTGASLLTRDGWIINHSGSFNLTRFLQNNKNAKNSENDQFLTQRIEQRDRLQVLEDLLNKNDDAIETQQHIIKQAQRELDALSISLDETRAQSATITQEQHRTQQALNRAQSDFERWQADAKRLNREQDELNTERLELEKEQQTLMRSATQIKSDMNAIAPKIAAATQTYEQHQAARSEWRRARTADDEAWQALQLTVQKIKMQLEHSVSSLARANTQHDTLMQSEQKLSAQLLTYQDKIPTVQAALEQAKAERDAQQVLLSERDSVLTALKETHRTQQGQLDTQQTALQAAQTTLATYATELALSDARLDGASARVQALCDEARVSSLLTDFIAHQRRVRPDKIAELKNKAVSLEEQIQALGAVNLAAVAELKVVDERLAPLEQQTADIKASMDTLIDAIAAIDETTKSLFLQTLDAVNDELANLFAKVFGGGQASLSLNIDELPAGTPKVDQWRAGLTLMAQPKGKRNSRLAVLSGGEKTLTALSLIFAIFKQHPAPFCVLDEVDAPLDDANVTRFTSLISELAQDLQFIFISHNKLAMQIADELKGITMPSAGISSLVSVSLDEAADYLDN